MLKRSVTYGWTVAALAMLAALVVVWTPGAAVDAQGEMVAYEMVDRWPERDQAAEGLFQSPIDMDVAFDGRVYVADPGIGGVHTLLPSGAFTTPFGVVGGFPAQLGQVGPIAIGPDPMARGPFGGQRLYALDTAIDRVVYYDLDGRYQGHWDDIKGQGIAASMDGRVYVLDRETSQVRALDAASGDERFVFGTRGTDDGQFANFTDVDVSPDGRVLAVGDKRGLRVQLFDLPTDEALAGGGAAEPMTLRETYDLRQPKYTRGDDTCSASRVSAMGADAVFVGEGNGACIIDGRDVTPAIAASANSRTICRDTVRLPVVRPTAQQYFALATSDPNSGSCGSKRSELDTTPVIAQYDDQELRGVSTVWEAASNEDADSPVLFAPESISMPAADVLFVADSSSQLRFFNRDGEQIATAARDSSSGDFSADFEVFTLIEAVGAADLGDVYGFYFNLRRSGQAFNVETGIGLFRTIERQTRTGPVDVIEPVWTDVLASSFQQIKIPALAYNPVSNELLALRSNTIAQQRTEDVLIVRYSPDGDEIGDGWDLPDDGKSNPYSDMTVGPDGRIYVLDDINDIVRVLESDGTPVGEVPVAFDARSVAGGPPSADGAVFALREPGIVEQYADDGRVTARFDGRILDFSDPTTLTDITVDDQGMVYVADGQSSLIGVFAAGDGTEMIGVPEDRSCAFVGEASVDPAQINLGDLTTLNLEIHGRCGVGEEPTDIVIVVPYYQELERGVDPSASTITDMQRLMARVDFSRHRAAIVSYWNTTNVETPLTEDRAAYIDATRNVRRFSPPNENIKARLKDAMEIGQELFEPDSGRRQVMVLLRAEYCSVENEFFPGQCRGYPPAEDTALAIREAGTQIIALTSPGSFDLASSDEDAFFTIEDAHRRIVRYELPDVLATDVVLNVEIPNDMTVDPAGVSAGGTWTAPVASWGPSSVDTAGAAVSVGLEPTQSGTRPVMVQAVAEMVDGWGKPQQITFTVPEVVVIGATPTDPPPTPTDLPTAEPTAEPTQAATEPPQMTALFLPVVQVAQCITKPVPLDAALVIDISSSMNEPTADGGQAKIEAARQAAAKFVDALREVDQVAVVTFDEDATTLVGLTDDHERAREVIAGIDTGRGTRIDRGLAAATEALTARRDGASPVVILMTDGFPSGGLEETMLNAGAARDAGITIYTVGLGQQVDAVLLTAVSGDGARFLEAPRAEDLTAVYADLASRELLSCR